jgi:hypothetical protein
MDIFKNVQNRKPFWTFVLTLLLKKIPEIDSIDLLPFIVTLQKKLIKTTKKHT